MKEKTTTDVAMDVLMRMALLAIAVCIAAAIFVHPAHGQNGADEYDLIPVSSISRDTHPSISISDYTIWWGSETDNWGWMEALYNFATGELLIEMDSSVDPLVIEGCRHVWRYEDLLLIYTPTGDMMELHIDTGYLYWTLNGRTTCYPPNIGIRN